MIKYDEPRTWWLTDLQDDGPIPFIVIGRSDTHLLMASGSQDQIKGGYWEYFETKEQAEAVVAERLARKKATAAAEARIKACLAACECVDHLAPGCVAKLVEALVDIGMTAGASYDDEGLRIVLGDIEQLATAALAAMKGE